MNAKQLFISNENLRKQLAETINSSWFQECVVYANSAMMESGKYSIENLIGAHKLVETMKGMCQDEPVAVGFPKSGLVHDLENTRKLPDNPAVKQQEK